MQWQELGARLVAVLPSATLAERRIDVPNGPNENGCDKMNDPTDNLAVLAPVNRYRRSKQDPPLRMPVRRPAEFA
jgi:hypothetical protein